MLGAAAVAYVRRDVAVFPVEPGGKRPAGKLVPHGLKQASSEESDVLRWWGLLPEANIGLPTGLSFDVLDIDGPEGMAAIEAAMPLAERYEDDPTVDGPTCRTGGGGHHVYVAPTGVGNRAGLLPKVDWRGQGGYVVAPPSIHASGQRYAWLADWRAGEVSPKPAPTWLRKLLEPERPAPAPGGVAGAATAGTYGRKALESEIARVLVAPEGHRNHQLNTVAFSIGQLIAGGEIEDAVSAIEMLRTAGIRCGLSDKECVATLRSGLDSGSLQPRTAPARNGG